MSKKESNAVTSGDAAEKDVNIVINNRGSVDGLDAAAHAAMQQYTKGRSESTASNYSESGSKRRNSKAVMIEKGYEQVALADAEAGGGALSDKLGKSPYRAYTPEEKDEIFSAIGTICLLGLAFGAVVFMLGDDFMLVGGEGWSAWLLWQSSVVVGLCCKAYKVPPLLGNLITGIILKNLPGELVSGLPDTWSSIIRATGLSLILMRSGLELDVPMVMKQGWIAARLTVCPGLVEAMVVAGVSTQIFGMPFALAASLGFILAAVSPAVVVGGMFNLQKLGYGVAKGIPSLVVAAASFDDVVAISGYSMCIGAAISTGHGNATMSALEGPINIIAGVVVGAMGGAVCGMTRLFNTKAKRTLICVAMGLFLMYVSLSIHFHGAGALAGLVTTITASYFWQSGAWEGYFPYINLSLPASDEWHHETEHDIALVWEYAASPLLFAVIGASVDFSVLEASVIPSAILVVCCGALVRVPTAILVTGGKDLTWIERCFVGLAWIPKATVQAALGSVPLDLVTTYMSEDDEHYDEYKTYGEQILVTAVLAILITAPIGLICINTLGEKWLTLDVGDDTMMNDHDSDDEPGLSLSSRQSNKGDDDNNNNNNNNNSSSSSSSNKPSLEIATSTTGLSSSTYTSSADDGMINAKPMESFLDGVTSVFAEIAGRHSISDADEKQIAREEMKDLARRVGIITSVHKHRKRELATWEKNEQRKRMTTAAAKQLNKRLVVHYFHRTTDHVDSLGSTIKKIRDLSNKQGGLKATDVDSLDLDEAVYMAEAVMESVMACFNVIEGMEEKFPAEEMYELLETDLSDSDRSSPFKRGSKTGYDAVSGRVVYRQDSDGADPVVNSMEVLKRRGSSLVE